MLTYAISRNGDYTALHARLRVTAINKTARRHNCAGGADTNALNYTALSTNTSAWKFAGASLRASATTRTASTIGGEPQQ